MKISLLCFLFIFSTSYAYADKEIKIDESNYDYKCVNMSENLDLFSTIYLKKNKNCKNCYDLQLYDDSNELVDSKQVEKQSHMHSGAHFRGSLDQTSIIWIENYMSGFKGLTGYDSTFFYVKDGIKLFNDMVFCKHKNEEQSNI